MFAKASRIPLLLTMFLLPLLAGAATADKGAAAGNGSVSGTVKDAAGAVLQGAQIVLQPTATSVASDAQGNFVIADIAPGTYTVTVSYVGFDNSVTTVFVSSGQTATLNATMKVASANQQVIVTAGLVGDAAAINEQRTSANILDVKRIRRFKACPTPTWLTLSGACLAYPATQRG